MFIAVVLVAWALVRKLPVPGWAWRVPVYGIGTMAALAAVGGNRRKAAARLGISERTLYRKIREIEDEEDAEERSASAGPDAD